MIGLCYIRVMVERYLWDLLKICWRRFHKLRALVWSLKWVMEIPRVAVEVPDRLCCVLRYRINLSRRNLCSRVPGNKGGAGRRSFIADLLMHFNSLVEHMVNCLCSEWLFLLLISCVTWCSDLLWYRNFLSLYLELKLWVLYWVGGAIWITCS